MLAHHLQTVQLALLGSTLLRITSQAIGIAPLLSSVLMATAVMIIQVAFPARQIASDAPQTRYAAYAWMVTI